MREPDGVSELVRPVPEGVRLPFHPKKQTVILKRTQEVVVAGPSLVRAGHDRIHAAERRERADTLRGGSLARTNGSVSARCVLERSHDHCADGNHPAAAAFARLDGHRR